MSLRKQRNIMRIIVSAVIIIILGIVTVYKNDINSKDIKPASNNIQQLIK